MSGHDIVVVGASAGGLPALKGLLRALPGDLPASLFVVSHTLASGPMLLPKILDNATDLRVMPAEDGQGIEHGHIYVAPPDHHLLLARRRMRLSRGPRENRHRPAIDPLFRSAAVTFGPRVQGIVLSGMLDDGTSGLRAIKTCGGTTMVQDPAEALYPDMPSHALRNAAVDHCAPVGHLAEIVTRKAQEAADPRERYPVPESLSVEVEFASLQRQLKDIETLGAPSVFTCPSCKGSLTEVDDSGQLRFRCHTGHAFSAESLLAEQEDDLQNALYSAVRAVEENAALARRMVERWGERFPRERLASEEKAQELEQTAQVLRRVILGRTAGREG
ncbi:MAG: chemotaxis protein CheB [Gammaproteobacteria bacterium]|nr:chemotaxis protein CheB [Gammaproteobacteria bacterium]